MQALKVILTLKDNINIATYSFSILTDTKNAFRVSLSGMLKTVQHEVPAIISQGPKIMLSQFKSLYQPNPDREKYAHALMPCQPPLAWQPWTNLTCEKRLFSSQHQPDWCDVTRTNIMRLFHCLWSSIVSVYYRYRAWQGTDCVPGTCVPSKTNTGAGLISNPAVVLEACGREGD